MIKKMIKICLQCNSPFEKPYNTSKNIWINRSKFCSRECLSRSKIGKIPWNKGLKLNYIGHKIPHSPEAKRKMSEAHTKISQETRIKMSNAQKGKTGPKASNWRGGVTPLYAQIRNHFKMRQWRCDVFTRDKFTCCECSDNKGGNLNADHIIPFIAIVKSFQIDCIEKALNCEKLWDINNGRTLCENCHRKTDTYGQGAKNYEFDLTA